MNNLLFVLSNKIISKLLLLLLDRGIHSPKSMMHILYSPYFQKFIKFPSIFVRFTFFFSFPLFWPWCIYASCFIPELFN